MLYPTIDELTQQNKFNRYELALATAKCARLITEEYVRQHDVAEKSLTGNKEIDKPINTMIERELRDEKAVKVAINRIWRGEFAIDPNAGDAKEAEAAEEAPLIEEGSVDETDDKAEDVAENE